MQGNIDKTIWRRAGLIAILLPVCFFFPLVLILVGFLAWTIYEDFKTPQYLNVPPPARRDVEPASGDCFAVFYERCESPAEEQFLQVMVEEFDLKPNEQVLKSSTLTLEMQVEFKNYRFDFLANGRQVIEVDGATYHSSPEQQERDRVRDKYSVHSGYRVLRIPASVVFKTPDEAIRRVKDALAAKSVMHKGSIGQHVNAFSEGSKKINRSVENKRPNQPAMAGFKSAIAALAEVPVHAKPQNAKPVMHKKSIGQHINAFSEELEKINRGVENKRQKQLATTGFKLAISTEQTFLNLLVELAEMDQWADAKPAERRKIYDEVFAPMKGAIENEKPLSEVCKWEPIIKPDPVEDAELQRQIESEYRDAMTERDKRLSKLKERCAEDPVFTRYFCRKMIEAKYPTEDVVKIVGYVTTDSC